MKSWTTRMGLTAIIVLTILAVSGVTGCGGSGQASQSTTTVSAAPGTTTESTPPGTTGRTFTLDELAQFDGSNGAPAYVAVDGKQAPANMRSNLARMPVVGTLSQ